VKNQLSRPTRATPLYAFLGIIFTVSALSCLFLIPQVLAHAPVTPGDNESLATATFIPNPTKSWAIYAELHEGGEAQYYKFNITEGQRIHVMLLKSTSSEDREFTPGLVLMGPNVNNQGDVPDYVEVPVGADALVVGGEQPAQATYEPFSPSSFYSLADVALDAPSPGTYYIAVYEPSRGGHYGLAIGDREEYTLSEWILIPINLISVYQWEGQSLTIIFAPMGVTLAIGLGLIVWRLRNKGLAQTLLDWTGTLAGLLFLGSGAMILFQTALTLTKASLVPEIAVTLMLALIPILLGVVVLRLVLRSRGKVGIRKRVYLAILGLIALFAWAGLLVGPALALIASVLPTRARVSSQRRNSGN
jgi:hypothetical protein